jgi:hypothetical protein
MEPPTLVAPKGMTDVPLYKSIPYKIMELFNNIYTQFDFLLIMVDPCVANPKLGCGPYAA